jgi:hypothetical protein
VKSTRACAFESYTRIVTAQGYPSAVGSFPTASLL